MRRWDDQEEQFLIKNYRRRKIDWISRKINRTPDSIKHKASKMGLWKSRRWTKKEINYLIDSLGDRKIRDIAKQLVRTKGSVYNMLHKLGIKLSENNELSVDQVAKKIGVSRFFLVYNINRGYIQCDREFYNKKNHLLTPEIIREFAIEHYTFKLFTCMDCDTKVQGDVYCPKHVPPLQKKYKPKSFHFNFNLENRNEVKCKMTGGDYSFPEMLMLVKKSSGLTYPEISVKSGYSHEMIKNIINGRQEKFNLEKLSCVLLACGFKSRISVSFDGKRHLVDILSRSFRDDLVGIFNEIRKKNNLTQAEFCSRIDRGYQWFSYLIYGQSNIWSGHLENIAKSFDIKIEMEIVSASI